MLNLVKIYWVNILEAGAIITLVSIFRFLLFPEGVDNYGYDYGFYNYAVQHTPLNSINYFLGQAHDYGNHLFVIINWLRIPQLPFLHISFYLLQSISGVILYFYLKKYSVVAAVSGVVLFCVSIAQNQLHSMFLWQAVYGQLLLIILLISLQYKKWWPAIISAVLLLISHKSSVMMAIIASTLYSLFSIKNIKQLLVVSATIVALSGWFAWYFNIYQDILAIYNSNIYNGIFMSRWEYFSHAWHLILLASLGLYWNWKQQFIPWHALLIVTIAWLIFSLPFFERIILYLDLSLILFGSLGIAGMYKKIQSNKKIVVVLLILTVSIVQLFIWQSPQPKISEQEKVEIKNFAQYNQGDFVLSLSSKDAPWLLAYLSGDIRLAAPGLFEDIHTQKQWQQLTDINSQDFFTRYPQPLSVYNRSDNNLLLDNKCFQKISEHFYKFTCK